MSEARVAVRELCARMRVGTQALREGERRWRQKDSLHTKAGLHDPCATSTRTTPQQERSKFEEHGNFRQNNNIFTQSLREMGI